MKPVQYNVPTLVRRIVGLLPSMRRRQLGYLFLGMLAVAGMETFFLGGVALFVSSVSSPEQVLNSTYVQRFQSMMGIGTISHQQLILWTALLSVIMVVMKNSLQLALTYASSRFSGTLAAYFGNRLLAAFLAAPYQWHLKRNSADLVLAVEWRTYLGGKLFNPLLLLLKDVLTVACLLTAMIIVEPLMTGGVVVFAMLLGKLVFTRLRTRLDGLAVKARRLHKSVNRLATTTIHGMKDIRICGHERKFMDYYDEESDQLVRLAGTRATFTRMPEVMMETGGIVLLMASIICMLFLLNFSEARTTAMIALLAVTAWRVLPAIQRIIVGATNIRNTLPFVQNELDYLDAIGDYRLPRRAQGEDDLSLKTGIGLRNVAFRYEEGAPPALSDIDFDIPKGAVVGVVGRSGAGKSTLVNLLIGLLEPTQGHVVLDGEVLDKDKMQRWIHAIGYVPQTPYILDATLAENIAFGIRRDELDEDRVRECCEMAAIDFLDQLPDAIDTNIGERGARLSGGQLQRVAIARALYNRPELIIFDEATSALDASNEAAIQKTIRGVHSLATVVIIAHKLSVVSDCDYLVWLDAGRIRKIGPPAEILAEYGEDMAGGEA